MQKIKHRSMKGYKSKSCKNKMRNYLRGKGKGKTSKHNKFINTCKNIMKMRRTMSRMRHIQ